MKKIKFIITVILVMSIFSMSIFAETAFTKKRIYISNLERKSGISTATAEKIRDIIKITILEKNSNEYRIISDDDIKIMFKQAETLQSIENQDKNTTLNIAEAINADEIIYGIVSRENGKIHINISNLETGIQNNRKNAGTKSIADITFDESELEYMSREAAIKLMNPKYRINLNTNSTAPVKFENLKINQIKSDKINEIKFKKDDSNLKAIVDYYMTIMNEGDALYEAGKYPEARAKYLDITNSIETKMTSENQIKIQAFTDILTEKISNSIFSEVKLQIEKIDQSIETEKNPSESDFKNAYDNYNKIVNNVYKITTLSEYNKKIIVMLENRTDYMLENIIAFGEKKGDSYYNNYDFYSAIKEYNEASLLTGKIVNEKKKLKISNQLASKYIVAKTTAGNNLENEVYSLIDQAEYFNITNNNSSAKKSLKKAKSKILKERKFASLQLAYKYNDYVEKVPGAEYITESEMVLIQRSSDNPEKEITKKDINMENTVNTINGASECIETAVCTGIILFLAILYAIYGPEVPEEEY